MEVPLISESSIESLKTPTKHFSDLREDISCPHPLCNLLVITKRIIKFLHIFLFEMLPNKCESIHIHYLSLFPLGIRDLNYFESIPTSDGGRADTLATSIDQLEKEANQTHGLRCHHTN